MPKNLVMQMGLGGRRHLYPCFAVQRLRAIFLKVFGCRKIEWEFQKQLSSFGAQILLQSIGVRHLTTSMPKYIGKYGLACLFQGQKGVVGWAGNGLRVASMPVFKHAPKFPALLLFREYEHKMLHAPSLHPHLLPTRAFPPSSCFDLYGT